MSVSQTRKLYLSTAEAKTWMTNQELFQKYKIHSENNAILDTS